MNDLLNAIQTGDPRCVMNALKRAVPDGLRRAYAEGEQAALAGWPKGTCPLDGDERAMWLSGWEAMQTLARDPMAEAQQRDLDEHRDLHDGNVVDHDRPSEGSNL